DRRTTPSRHLAWQCSARRRHDCGERSRLPAVCRRQRNAEASVSERFYRRILLLLPRSLRHEAEAELIDTFRPLYARARVQGRVALARFWIRMIADLIVVSG